MLLHLKEVFKDIVIINPYINFVINFLKDSSFYKRDFDKFNGILKTITALNYYNHEVHDIDGEMVILTNLSDVQQFMSILHPYKESISANLSPKAVEILNDIRNNIDDWIMEINPEELSLGITTNLSKDSVKKYIYELANNGFLQITDHSGKSNVYNLTKSEVAYINDDLKRIDDSIHQIICREVGEWVVDIMMEDKFVEDLSIMNFDSEVKKPPWL